MELNDNHIVLIEKALGFKLYEWQIRYLKGEAFEFPEDRRQGKTTAYIVNLLLNNYTAIDIKRDAIKLKDINNESYATMFAKLMTEINDKLESVGFETKVVKPKTKPKKSLSIELNADTTNLSLKLKAIAKHAESLANELDMIDKLSEENDIYASVINLNGATISESVIKI